MIRVNRIISAERYRFYLEETGREEAGRKFCCHHFEHLLAVARLTYLLLLEDGFPYISREIAYAAGLLHDIGRFEQYRKGVDHAEASANLAASLLAEAGFSLSEAGLITEAISQHRLHSEGKIRRSPLGRALKEADGYSRTCFFCEARELCHGVDRRPHREGLKY